MEMNKDREMDLVVRLLAPQIAIEDWSQYKNKAEKYKRERELVNKSRRIIQFTWRQINKINEPTDDEVTANEEIQSIGQTERSGILGFFRGDKK